jgi:phosphoribosyl 1,2-cyclic phosphodiesterase
VLNAGTGLQELSKTLDGESFRGSLLLSHLHWDHTHGMPFFRSGLLDGHQVDVYVPEQRVDPEELLARPWPRRTSRSGRKSWAAAGPFMP